LHKVGASSAHGDRVAEKRFKPNKSLQQTGHANSASSWRHAAPRVSRLLSWLFGFGVPMSAHIAGELACWPTKDGMAAILHDAGLRVHVGRYSVRIQDCSHFVFQEYGGDLGEPTIDADADTVEELMREGRLVSDALACAGVRHRFEIYNDKNELCGYLHYQWPLKE
jgi:hypothetical protein